MMLVCSNASPRRHHRRRARSPRSSTSSRIARHGATCASATRRWRGARHVNRYRHAWSIVKAADHPHLGLVLDSFHILSLRRRSGRHRGDSRREDLLPADGRRAAACRWTCCSGAATTAAFRVRASSTWRASSSRCWSPAIRDRCRSRSSTTSSARRRTGARRSMRCGRCSTSRSRRACGSSERRRRAMPRPTRGRARRAHRAVRPAGGAAVSGLAFLEFAVDEATEWLLANVLEVLGIPSRRTPPLEARHAVPPRLDQPDPQCRAGLVRARAFQPARAVDLRDKPHDRRSGARAQPRDRTALSRASTAGSGRTSKASRR